MELLTEIEKVANLFWSEPGSRPDLKISGPGGKSELRMAASSDGRQSGHWRRGDPTESATENRPPLGTNVPRSKGEKAGQEPTGPMREHRELGKPLAEQDQVREDHPTDPVRSGTRRPVSSTVPFAGSDSRVGRVCPAEMPGLDKWLPLQAASCGPEKTEFGLSAHSIRSFKQ